MKRLMLAVLFSSLTCGLAWASEDELAKAKSAFTEADRQLNQQYQLTRKALRESDFEALREEQRGWLRYRDSRSLAAVHYEDRTIAKGEEQTSPHFWQMMAGLTLDRTEMVRAWRDTRWDKPLTGRYADDYGGTILLLQKDDKLYFKIEVVRGPTYHLGSIAGIAQINGPIARFSDQDTESKDRETWVTMITGGRRLKLITANAQYYHGARAYFDGEYLRVADLTADEKKLVINEEPGP